MPTENELKFVINEKCEKEVKKICEEKYEICQGYLIATRGITVRIRKSIKQPSKQESYCFTLKVNTAGRVIEIEKNINKRDFNDLWNIALNKLEKIRYILQNKKEKWELDFFKDYNGLTYMAVAEIEMPENKKGPDELPEIIKKNLIYKVPLTDNRFSNKLLGDAKYATEILRSLK